MTGSTHCHLSTECTFCALPWNGQSETLGGGGRQLPTAERAPGSEAGFGFLGSLAGTACGAGRCWGSSLVVAENRGWT